MACLIAQVNRGRAGLPRSVLHMLGSVLEGAAPRTREAAAVRRDEHAFGGIGEQCSGGRNLHSGVWNRTRGGLQPVPLQLPTSALGHLSSSRHHISAPLGKLLAPGDVASCRAASSAAAELEDGDDHAEELRPAHIFVNKPDISAVDEGDVNKYFVFSKEARDKLLGQAVPGGLTREWEAAGEQAVLLRAFTLDLWRRMEEAQGALKAGRAAAGGGGEAAEGEGQGAEGAVQTQFILDGPSGSGKSVAMATLVSRARGAGWLVLYVPSGQEWVQGGFYYPHQATQRVDTPVQAQEALRAFQQSHHDLLSSIPARILEPILLGEGAGVLPLKPGGAFPAGPDGQPTLPVVEGQSLADLVGVGVSTSHAAVGVLTRLREELGRVEEVPVMIAIDEFNAWFGPSRYMENLNLRGGQRRIPAHTLRMVDAFRPMTGRALANGVVVAAFSHSIGVARLPQELPDAPAALRIPFPRYNLGEAAAALVYYSHQGWTSAEATPDYVQRMFQVADGSGKDLRSLAVLA